MQRLNLDNINIRNKGGVVLDDSDPGGDGERNTTPSRAWCGEITPRPKKPKTKRRRRGRRRHAPLLMKGRSEDNEVKTRGKQQENFEALQTLAREANKARIRSYNIGSFASRSSRKWKKGLKQRQMEPACLREKHWNTVPSLLRCSLSLSPHSYQKDREDNTKSNTSNFYSFLALHAENLSMNQRDRVVTSAATHISRSRPIVPDVIPEQDNKEEVTEQEQFDVRDTHFMPISTSRGFPSPTCTSTTSVAEEIPASIYHSDFQMTTAARELRMTPWCANDADLIRLSKIHGKYRPASRKKELDRRMRRRTLSPNYHNMSLSGSNTRTLRRVSLRGCNSVTDMGVIALAEVCTSVVAMDLHGCTKITDQGIIAIRNNALDLRELYLDSQTDVTDKGIRLVSQRYPLIHLPSRSRYPHHHLFFSFSFCSTKNRYSTNVCFPAPLSPQRTICFDNKERWHKDHFIFALFLFATSQESRI